MRLIIFLAAIAVLFSLSDGALAQSAFAASVAAAPMSDQAGPSAQAAGLRMLSWPGKTVQAPRPRLAAPAAPVAAPSHRIWNPEAVAQPALAPMRAAPPAAAVQRTAALPSSIYAPAPPSPPAPAAAPQPPAPTPPPVMQQARAAARPMTQANSPSDGDYQPPHFYSLYREYGQSPDPIPLNPQFFAASTPDLAQPPPPVPHTVTTASGRVVQAVPPSPDDAPG